MCTNQNNTFEMDFAFTKQKEFLQKLKSVVALEESLSCPDSTEKLVNVILNLIHLYFGSQ